MTEPKAVPEMTEEEFERLLREDATPIDFDALMQAGVLEQRGAWYKILKKRDLPSHASKKIQEIRNTKDGETLVKFRVSTKRAEKMLRDFEAQKRG